MALPDPHTERAKREGVTRQEAKRRNFVDAYSVKFPLWSKKQSDKQGDVPSRE